MIGFLAMLLALWCNYYSALWCINRSLLYTTYNPWIFSNKLLIRPKSGAREHHSPLNAYNITTSCTPKYYADLNLGCPLFIEQFN